MAPPQRSALGDAENGEQCLRLASEPLLQAGYSGLGRVWRALAWGEGMSTNDNNIRDILFHTSKHLTLKQLIKRVAYTIVWLWSTAKMRVQKLATQNERSRLYLHAIWFCIVNGSIVVDFMTSLHLFFSMRFFFLSGWFVFAYCGKENKEEEGQEEEEKEVYIGQTNVPQSVTACTRTPNQQCNESNCKCKMQSLTQICLYHEQIWQFSDLNTSLILNCTRTVGEK